MEKRTAQEKEKYQPSYETTILTEVSGRAVARRAWRCGLVWGGGGGSSSGGSSSGSAALRAPAVVVCSRVWSCVPLTGPVAGKAFPKQLSVFESWCGRSGLSWLTWPQGERSAC